jgi:metal-dependent amidase/aminoacylase/carboxypeptidase family protein
LSGSVRTADEAWRDELPAHFERVVQGVTAALGCTYRLHYDSRHLPATVNDPALTDTFMAVAHTVSGPERVHRMAEPRLAAESFRFYAERVPSVYWLLGVGNPERGARFPSHHPKFDIDEDALAVGVTITAAAAWELLAPRDDYPATVRARRGAATQ